MSRPVTLALVAALAPLAMGALALAGGVSAGAATDDGDVIFDGRGFGHGVGLSQYGARGRALAGWDHPRILAHYYPGTALTIAPPRTIRVLLAERAPMATLVSARPWRVAGRTAAGRRVLRLRAGVVHRARPLPGGRVVVERGGRRIAAFTGPVRFETVARGGVVGWGPKAPERDRRYRGALRVGTAQPGGLRVANIVRIEDYLRGVVAEEMPASWGDDAPAALRAQSVAARSYALATLRRGSDFEVYDDTRSQVYGGVAAEDARTTRAVAATRGAVLTFEGAIATTYFHSTSGGRTEASHRAWPGSPPLPYLVSVADPFDAASPLHTWTVRFSAARAGTLLRVGGPVTAIEVLERGDSPRVLRARVTTTAGGSVELTGAEMRARLGLYDTWFDVRVGG
ncbi:MAG: SpoIID/LytB domain-containing protein [Thermoleophilia bacterium]